MKRSLFCIGMLLLAAVWLLGTGCQKASTGMHLVVATDSTWPPMELVNEKKEIVGFDIDLMSEISKAAGFTVEFKSTAWDGIFAGLDSNQYDAVISSVTITDERKKAYTFSDPYINAGQVLVVRADMKNITGLAQLRGKAVGAQIGTTGAFEIEKDKAITLRTYDEVGLAVEDLVNKRIDGIVVDTPVAANYVLQNPNYRDKLIIATKPFTEEYYGIVVKNGNTKVLEAINLGLKKVIDSGVVKALEDKWLR